MYNPTALKAGFSGVIGFLQANLPQIPQISAPLTTSSTGVYVQDKHPLVSLENIYYCAPDFGINNYPIWLSGSDYVLGFAVNDGGTLYVTTSALTPSTIAPHLDLAHWALFNPFQTWLLQKFNQGVVNLFAEVVKQLKLQDGGKAILEQQQLFRGVGNINTLIVPDGSAVGFEILPQQAEGLMVQIDKLGTQFTQAQTLNFYFYNSDKPSAALAVFAVPVGGSSNFSWSDIVNCIMQYMAQNTDSTYIFCYFEGDLNAGNQAVSKEWNCSSAPCAGCDGQDLLMYNRWSRYTAFRNIKIPPAGLDGYALPDLSQAIYGSKTNWGMNFSLTVRCDLTNFILYKPFLYADVLAMQICLELLKTMAHTTRIDPAVAQIKVNARAELNVMEKSTFINRYWESIESLELDMSGFSSSCQPCTNGKKQKAGKYRSV